MIQQPRRICIAIHLGEKKQIFIELETTDRHSNRHSLMMNPHKFYIYHWQSSLISKLTRGEHNTKEKGKTVLKFKFSYDIALPIKCCVNSNISHPNFLASISGIYSLVVLGDLWYFSFTRKAFPWLSGNDILFPTISIFTSILPIPSTQRKNFKPSSSNHTV